MVLWLLVLVFHLLFINNYNLMKEKRERETLSCQCIHAPTGGVEFHIIEITQRGEGKYKMML